MAKGSGAEPAAHPITLRAHWMCTHTQTQALPAAAQRGADTPRSRRGGTAGARTVPRDVVAALTPLLRPHSHFRGHVRGGRAGGRLRGSASGRRRRRGGGEVEEGARRAKEGEKRLPGEGQEGLKAVRRFSAG